MGFPGIFPNNKFTGIAHYYIVYTYIGHRLGMLFLNELNTFQYWHSTILPFGFSVFWSFGLLKFVLREFGLLALSHILYTFIKIILIERKIIEENTKGRMTPKKLQWNILRTNNSNVHQKYRKVNSPIQGLRFLK